MSAVDPAVSRGWGAALAVYARPRLLVVLAMGFASGLPRLLTLSTLSYWLSKLGVDKTSIGLFALLGLPYTLKFVWAPLFDLTPPPGLARLGRRRGWLLPVQALLVPAIYWLGHTDPLQAPLATALAALAVAFLSASQDVIIDAYRIEILHDSEQGAGAGATQVGYRFGLLAAGAGAVAAADFIAWPWVFTGLAALAALNLLLTALAPEPHGPAAPARPTLQSMIVAPFRDFVQRPAWPLILLFVLFYKFGDAVSGGMANPFYNEMGFSGVEIATITKLFGVVATLAGALAGGAIVARLGMLPALLLGGVLQAATNLTFAWLAGRGHDLVALTCAIGADNVAGGLASAAFVAYLSWLCNQAYTATQYALLTSFMSVGMTFFAAGGGWLADRLSWAQFWSGSALLALPGIALLLWLMRHPGAAQPAAAPARG